MPRHPIYSKLLFTVLARWPVSPTDTSTSREHIWVICSRIKPGSATRHHFQIADLFSLTALSAATVSVMNCAVKKGYVPTGIVPACAFAIFGLANALCVLGVKRALVSAGGTRRLPLIFGLVTAVVLDFAALAIKQLLDANGLTITYEMICANSLVLFVTEMLLVWATLLVLRFGLSSRR